MHFIKQNCLLIWQVKSDSLESLFVCTIDMFLQRKPDFHKCKPELQWRVKERPNKLCTMESRLSVGSEALQQLFITNKYFIWAKHCPCILQKSSSWTWITAEHIHHFSLYYFSLRILLFLFWLLIVLKTFVRRTHGFSTWLRIQKPLRLLHIR